MVSGSDCAASGVPATFLHLCAYTENFTPKKGADGALSFTVPMGDHPLAVFSVGDVGQAVVTVLSNTSAHAGKTYGLVTEYLTGTGEHLRPVCVCVTPHIDGHLANLSLPLAAARLNRGPQCSKRLYSQFIDYCCVRWNSNITSVHTLRE